MREYKVVNLNKGIKFSRDKDLEQAEEIMNELAAQGWILQQLVSPNDLGGSLIGTFYREI